MAYSDGLDSYGLDSDGLDSDGLDSYGLDSYGPWFVPAAGDQYMCLHMSTATQVRRRLCW